MKGTVLGIEGTAWNLSVAIVNEQNVIAEVSDMYSPPTGGIHPREAAQHHAKCASHVIKAVLREAKRQGIDASRLDAISFSQGPGLGACLRTVATAARMLSITLNIPLVGVNHCLAHVEVGRWKTEASDPVTLYVSGANSQVLAYRKGRYRVFGETLDIGLGNAFDKFARSAGLGHPGGPKIEDLAKKATRYISLPYVVKGMDLSFSGLSTAATEALKANSIEDVCYSFQETAFSMVVEVTERALAHTGKYEVLLAGGVGANMRLREMLDIMCNERGALFYVPERRFMGDNGSMIAYLGLLMYDSGNTLKIEDSHVDPNFRPDDVNVTWIQNDLEDRGISYEIKNGAEAIVKVRDDMLIKDRISKQYRLKELDERIRKERTKAEARILSEARRSGVPTPVIYDIEGTKIKMQYIDGIALKHVIDEDLSEQTGVLVARLHTAGMIHGDLTTSNLLLLRDKIYMIDFGLSFFDSSTESRGVDVHVLFQTFESTHHDHTRLIEAFCKGYREHLQQADEVLERVKEIKKRGRYA